jgi:hypothetical protein
VRNRLWEAWPMEDGRFACRGRVHRDLFVCSPAHPAGGIRSDAGEVPDGGRVAAAPRRPAQAPNGLNISNASVRLGMTERGWREPPRRRGDGSEDV